MDGGNKLDQFTFWIIKSSWFDQTPVTFRFVDFIIKDVLMEAKLLILVKSTLTLILWLSFLCAVENAK